MENPIEVRRFVCNYIANHVNTAEGAFSTIHGDYKFIPVEKIVEMCSKGYVYSTWFITEVLFINNDLEVVREPDGDKGMIIKIENKYFEHVWGKSDKDYFKEVHPKYKQVMYFD